MKNRFKPLTFSGIGMLLFCLFITLSFVAIIVAIALDSVPEGIDIALDIVLMVVTFVSLALSIASLIVFEIIDRKKNGRGIWSAMFSQELTNDKKHKLASLFRQHTFASQFLQDKIIAQRVMPGFTPSTAFFVIEYDGYGSVQLNAYNQTASGKSTTLIFGMWGMMFHRKYRKLTAQILNILDAPSDIRV